MLSRSWLLIRFNFALLKLKLVYASGKANVRTKKLRTYSGTRPVPAVGSGLESPWLTAPDVLRRDELVVQTRS